MEGYKPQRIRVAISGPHGVGKSTLARRIADELCIWYIPEVARELLDKARDRNWKEFSAEEACEFEKAIIHSHLFYIKQANRMNTSFVSDRSVFDAFGYIDWQEECRGMKLGINYHRIKMRDSYLPYVDKILFFKFREEDNPDESQWWFQNRLEKFFSFDPFPDIVVEIDRKTEFEEIIRIITSTGNSYQAQKR